MAAEYELVAMQALRKNPRDAAAWNAWGEALVREADAAPPEQAAQIMADAAQKFTVATDLDPLHPNYWQHLGVALYHQAVHSPKEEAISLFVIAGDKYYTGVRLVPRWASVWDGWARTYAQRARRSQGADAAQLFYAAQVRYAVATELSPKNADYWYNWGLALYWEAGQQPNALACRSYCEAAEKFARAAHEQIDQPHYWHWWGVALFNIGLKSDAVAAPRWLKAAYERFTIAANLAPDSGIYRLCLAETRRVQAPYEAPEERIPLYIEAQSQFAVAIEYGISGYSLPSIYDQWGFVAIAQGRLTDGEEAVRLFAQAATIYTKAIDLEPNNARYQDGRCVALTFQAAQSEEQEAAALFQEIYDGYAAAIHLEPENPNLWTNWSHPLYLMAYQSFRTEEEKTHYLAEGVEKSSEAIRLDPTMVQAWINESCLKSAQSRMATDEERERLLQEAEESGQEAERLEIGQGAYALATVAVLRGDISTSQHWLEHGLQYKSLPRRVDIEEDIHFEMVRQEKWFEELLERSPRYGV